MKSLRGLAMPPSYDEELSPAHWHDGIIGHLVVALVAITLDVVILFALRGDPAINHEALWFFALFGINLLIIAASLPLLLLHASSSNTTKRRLFYVVTAIDCLVIIIWVQLTGTSSSYFAMTGAMVIFSFRIYLGYRVGLVALLALLTFHGGAVVLEAAGLLRPAALFVDHDAAMHSVAAYRWLVIASIGSGYGLAFLGSNLITNKLRDKDRAIAEFQQEAVQAARVATEGRFTGVVLAGEYMLGEVLGRGGMGEVYLARCITDGSRVAIKVMHSHLLNDAVSVERFRREARAAERVPSHFTAAILDVGYDQDEAVHYIAMEHLHGEDLATLLARRPKLPVDQALTIARGVARAIDAAHQHGVVHRDIKPENIFLVRPGPKSGYWAFRDPGPRSEVRLLDFGLGKITCASEQTLTQADLILGTVGYMPPEQVLGQRDQISPATDRFAVAAVVYEMLTGRSPFRSAGLLDAIHEVMYCHPPAPSTLRPELPEQIDAIMTVALAKAPGDRYASALAMVDDLDAACRDALAGQLLDQARTLVDDIANANTAVALPYPDALSWSPGDPIAREGHLQRPT